MTDKVAYFNEKILQFKKRREKVQTQQALSFMKETQKIFKDEFSAPLALTVMTESWGEAPKTKREHWKKICSKEGDKPQTFPNAPLQKDGKKVSDSHSEDHQS